MVCVRPNGVSDAVCLVTAGPVTVRQATICPIGMGTNTPTCTDSKTCIRCGVAKPLDQFPPERRNRDGRRADCRPCRNSFEARRRDPVVERAKARERRRKKMAEVHGERYASQSREGRRDMRWAHRQWRRGKTGLQAGGNRLIIDEMVQSGLTVMSAKWKPHHSPDRTSHTEYQRNRDAAVLGYVDASIRSLRELDDAADKFLAKHDHSYGDGTYFVYGQTRLASNLNQHQVDDLPNHQTS